MTLRYTFRLFLPTLLALLLVGCGQDASEDYGRNRVKLRLSMGDYVPREVRAIATDAEQNVKTLDVVFFNAAGALQTLDGHSVFSYDADHPNPSDWVNGTVDDKTVYLHLQRDQVKSLKAMALINLPSTIKTQLENGTITTLTQLQQTVAATITTATDIPTLLIMAGDADVPAAPPANYTIQVEVKRLVAKMEVSVYYEWDKLVVPSATPGTAKSYYTYKDFDSRSYIRVDGSETEMPVPKTETPKVSTFPAVYINEYEIADRATTPSPYILLRLPAILGEDNDLTRLFPPPAGGDFTKTPVDNYYKVVLPERIDRNCLYKVHARILGPGSPTPEGAPIIKFKLLVQPWSPTIIVPGA